MKEGGGGSSCPSWCRKALHTSFMHNSNVYCLIAQSLAYSTAPGMDGVFYIFTHICVDSRSVLEVTDPSITGP